ncbi:MAG: RibD family protein [Pseudonocardiaceae bacterium]
METLFDVSDPGTSRPPGRLAERYGGGLSFTAPCLYANFVSTLDGVTALEPAKDSSAIIAAKSAADRFVMGLLRALSDAVLIGAGTLRPTPGALWTPEFIFPSLAPAYAELRTRLGYPLAPKLIVVSATGALEPTHPAFQAGALVLTTTHGAARLEGQLPDASRVLVLGERPRLTGRAIMETLYAKGYGVILTEGGPQFLADLLAENLLDELFLTVSPVLAGRIEGQSRPGLIQGLEFPPSNLPAATLLSVRQHDSHLFLRYRFP